MAGPLISVITPVWNAGVFLRSTIASVLAQTEGNFEFLILDDGSTDGSRDCLATLTDPRIRVVLNERNVGVAATRNRALAMARGEYVAFLNHDDLALPERFARQVAFLRTHPHVMILGTAIETFDGEGRALAATHLPGDDLSIRWLGLVECPLRQSTLMVRREFIQLTGLRYRPEYLAHSDYGFIMDALALGQGANLLDALVHYRRHEGSLSKRGHARLVAEGNQIATEAIARELPGNAPTLAQVALMRWVLLGYRETPAGRSLAETKAGWNLYLDLLAAFRKKHGAPADNLPVRQTAPPA